MSGSQVLTGLPVASSPRRKKGDDRCEWGVAATLSLPGTRVLTLVLRCVTSLSSTRPRQSKASYCPQKAKGIFRALPRCVIRKSIHGSVLGTGDRGDLGRPGSCTGCLQLRPPSSLPDNIRGHPWPHAPSRDVRREGSKVGTCATRAPFLGHRLGLAGPQSEGTTPLSLTLCAWFCPSSPAGCSLLSPLQA